jgi:hypothetical protein
MPSADSLSMKSTPKGAGAKDVGEEAGGFGLSL